MIAVALTPMLWALPAFFAIACGVAQNASTVNITCLGDSFTVGQVPTTTLGAYRPQLNTNIAADVIAVPQVMPGPVVIGWIGPQNQGSQPSNHHDGVAGTACADHVNGTNGATAISALFGAGNPYSPQIVLIAIGHNDSVATFQDATTGYTKVVTSIHALLPNAVFVLSTVPGKTSGTFDTMNAWLVSTAWPAFTAAGIQYVTADPYSVMDQVNDFAADGHPNATGYIHMGNVYGVPLRQAITIWCGGTL